MTISHKLPVRAFLITVLSAGTSNADETPVAMLSGQSLSAAKLAVEDFRREVGYVGFTMHVFERNGHHDIYIDTLGDREPNLALPDAKGCLDRTRRCYWVRVGRDMKVVYSNWTREFRNGDFETKMLVPFE